MLNITPAMLNLKIKQMSEDDCLWCLAANAAGCRIMPEYCDFSKPEKSVLHFLDFLEKLGYTVCKKENAIPNVFYNAAARGGSFQSGKLREFLLFSIVILALTKGSSKISGIKKLPIEKRDQLFRLIGCLKKMGAAILTDNDKLLIEGKQVLYGAELSVGGDREIFQALLLAALKCEGNLNIKGISNTEDIFPLSLSEVYNKLNTQITDKISQKKNIVLIGMSGAGKTTVGQLLSEKLDMPFFDSDEEFEKEENCKINDVFAEKGEEYFRKRETEVIKRLSAKSGIIISTGGGIVIKRENTDVLKKNGIIIYLDRDIETIANTVSSDDRPLFKKGKEAVIKLFKSREAMYLSSADFKVDNNGEPENAVLEIRKIYDKVVK